MNDKRTEWEALAIAYLTGQATQSEIETYGELYETDPAFKAIVRDIEVWLAPLNDAVVDMAPPEGLFEDIMAEIRDGDSGAVEPVPSSAANDNDAGKWRALAIAASAIAILAIGSHFLPNSEKMPTENETFMALLSDESQPELMAIVYEPKTGRVIARLSNITVPKDGDLQLWLIREGEETPVSLGVLENIDGLDQIQFTIPKRLQTGTDTLAISLEKLGGSRSEGPEGPVLYTGSVSDLHLG